MSKTKEMGFFFEEPFVTPISGQSLEEVEAAAIAGGAFEEADDGFFIRAQLPGDNHARLYDKRVLGCLLQTSSQE